LPCLPGSERLLSPSPFTKDKVFRVEGLWFEFVLQLSYYATTVIESEAEAVEVEIHLLCRKAHHRPLHAYILVKIDCLDSKLFYSFAAFMLLL
jgi:hypothetical protein